MISVVIVNWNSGPLLESCVQSLFRNAAGSQIVIVDNDSTDSSLQFAEIIPGPLIVRNSRNIGFAAANNLGWRASPGTSVLFLNPDTECFPESAACLEQVLAADKSIWAAGGQLVNLAGERQSGYVRLFPSIRTVAAEMLLIDKIWPSNPWSGINRVAGSTREMDVDQPAAACLMVSRTALEKTGGFDESFRPAWFEDVDLCRRIRNQGGRIRYQPRARFLHHGGYSLGRLSWQDFLECFHANQIRYFQKHQGTQAALRVRRLIVTGLLLRSGLSLVRPLAPNESRKNSAKTYWSAACHISKLSEAIT